MIHDEFTNRADLSRQRKNQLRRMRDGVCLRCKKPAVTKEFCEEHRRLVNSQVLDRLHKKKPEMRRRRAYASRLRAKPSAEEARVSSQITPAA
jgi:hypothetical protein